MSISSFSNGSPYSLEGNFQQDASATIQGIADNILVASSYAEQISKGVARPLMDYYDLYQAFKTMFSPIRSRSLIEKAQILQVTPMTMIDRSLRTTDELSPVLQIVLNLFSGFYMQGAIMTLSGLSNQTKCKIMDINSFGNASTSRKLEAAFDGVMGKMNLAATAIKEPMLFAVGGKAYLRDGSVYNKDLEYMLSKKKAYNAVNGVNATTGITQESIASVIRKTVYNPFTGLPTNVFSVEDKNDKEDNSLKLVKEGDKALNGKDIIKQNLSTLEDDSRLTVGKNVLIEVRDNNTVHTVPMTIRLMTNFANPNMLIEVMSFGSRETELFDREIKYKLGKLSLFGDVFLKRDMYKDHLRKLIRDETGYYRNMLEARASTGILTALTGLSNQVNITGIFVVSDSTVVGFEQKTGIKLTNPKQRNRLFTDIGCMIMAVIDSQHRLVRFYLHSMDRFIETSFSDLKKANKAGTNIDEIIRAMSQGNTPRLF